MNYTMCRTVAVGNNGGQIVSESRIFPQPMLTFPLEVSGVDGGGQGPATETATEMRNTMRRVAEMFREDRTQWTM
jgi:hypothetical protein